MREHRQRICADLVGDVAVGGDAIGADDHEVDVARAHQRRGRAVGDEGGVDAQPFQLEHREAGTLQQGTSLVDPHAGRAT